MPPQGDRDRLLRGQAGSRARDPRRPDLKKSPSHLADLRPLLRSRRPDNLRSVLLPPCRSIEKAPERRPAAGLKPRGPPGPQHTRCTVTRPARTPRRDEAAIGGALFVDDRELRRRLAPQIGWDSFRAVIRELELRHG